MNKIKKSLFSTALFCVLLLPVLAQADYIGPGEVLSLPWGKGDSEMGIHSFPRGEYCSLPYDKPIFSVSSDDVITLLDYCNNKIKYYKDGVLQRVAEPDDKTVQELMMVPMQQGNEQKWERVSEISGKASVVFGNDTVTLVRRGAYFRDKKGFFYTILQHVGVWKVDSTGKELGSISVRYQVFTDREDYEGGPIVDPQGNVYFWKWFPDRFRIFKWTWRETQELYGLPDAPRYVEAHQSKSGTSLIITWWSPFQKRESITAYELVRSTKSGTPPYSVIGVLEYKPNTPNYFPAIEDTTAKAGVTYYYRMRSISDGKYSAYSNEAIGRR